MSSRHIATCLLIGIELVLRPAAAAVSRVEITERHAVAGGRSFGEVGAYEALSGRVHFEIDPENPRNRVIADLDRAPRNVRGRVEMSADLSILVPRAADRGNGVALVDVVNRGRKVAPRLNHATGADEVGDGFLMRRGYAIVAVGWEFDVEPGPAAIRVAVPRAEGSGAPIGGLGYAAVRDVAAWLKHAPDAIAPARRAMAFGVSQTGRFLRNYLYLGFNTDEAGRQVFDSMIVHIAGASRLDLNRPGAEPISLGMFSATSFPFADRALRDPVTGVTDGELDNPRARADTPLLFYTNTSVEYWGGGRVAALVHSTPDGSADIELPENVRFYFLSGTQHGPGPFPAPPAEAGEQRTNPIDYWWSMRALLVAMERWMLAGEGPPQSVYPSLRAGTLVTPEGVRFPSVPGVRSPAAITAKTRVANMLLPQGGGRGAVLPLLVPQVDGDGNETSGIRHPQVTVPLATYTGWNFRRDPSDDPNALVPLAGSYVPFAATRAQRVARHDPRLSIEERYASRADYLQRVEAAAQALVAQRYLLGPDVAPILERAGRHWDLLVGGTR